MLDSETKRRIDTARDILVGKIPDPKSQIEQITIALIYKFMDDMDKKSEELGGKAKFFTENYSKYAWSKILDSSVSGLELVNTYGEAIQKMNQNPNLPQLFRDIFKNAYLPYRDPETLRSFLRIIDDFKYDHSERLGDAFEYLLSVMGSQGDAGQFRTPRHIIDFIVKVVDPSKDDTILDPACGTAGFLISAYKHILEKHREEGKLNLTPDERKRLNENVVGYDISPDMVRLSLVNLYLHGFKNPNIIEYDTLSSDDKWDETFDVALANPPFMTPKGGIRPHKRFSVQSNRTEVLFVDYIQEHLNTDGKAGIVVPEGIIFQSGMTYKQLRKMLIENSLYAVVSLPAGVFNPYSGVKTSILFLDKTLAKKTKDVLFVKVEADGFNLGAQRREIKDNDLPLALEVIQDYQSAILLGEEPKLEKFEKTIAHIVPKEKLKENDWNLSGDRYKEEIIYDGNWDLVELGEVCEILGGYAFKSSELKKDKFQASLPVVKIGNVNKSGKLNLENIQHYKYEDNLSKYLIKKDDVLVAMTGATVGKVAVSQYNKLLLNQRVGLIRAKENISKKYVKCLLLSDLFYDYCQRIAGGGAQGNISPKEILQFKIPLPLLEFQERIVEEIENYQNIIDGAKKVVGSYKPSFKIDPDWDVVELGEVTNIISGQSPESKYYNSEGKGIPFYQGRTEFGRFYLKEPKYWTQKVTKLAKANTILMSVRAPVGPVNITKNEICIGRGLASIEPREKINLFFIFFHLLGIQDKIKGNGGAVFDSITRENIEKIKIPLPPLEIQKEIVAQIEEEQKLVDSNTKLIQIFEQKIKDKIAEVWGE